MAKKEQQPLVSIEAPAHLPQVQILAADRQPIIDYFVVKSMQYRRYSWEGSHISTILDALRKAIDPIASLERPYTHAKAQGISDLYQEALEMLYMVRHRLEAGYLVVKEGGTP